MFSGLCYTFCYSSCPIFNPSFIHSVQYSVYRGFKIEIWSVQYFVHIAHWSALKKSYAIYGIDLDLAVHDTWKYDIANGHIYLFNFFFILECLNIFRLLCKILKLIWPNNLIRLIRYLKLVGTRSQVECLMNTVKAWMLILILTLS